MQRENCWGVGQVVFSGKDQLVAVRPMDDMLHMAMLNYDEALLIFQNIASTIRFVQALEKKIAAAYWSR